MRARRIALLAAFACTAAAAGPMLTPTMVRQDIRSRGARHAIEDLRRTGRWEAVTGAMDRGDAGWIALAPMLAPGSDAGSAEELGLALAFALPHNPSAVLSALDPHDGRILGADRVCGRPFIEDTEPAGYRARAVRALASIHNPGLLPLRRACLKALKAA